jgi:hypothetical protein
MKRMLPTFFPFSAMEFIRALLQVKMSKRLTVSKALAHRWLQGYQVKATFFTLGICP